MSNGYWEGFELTNKYAGRTNFETCYNELAQREASKLV
jgi:hypothetical protein